MPCPLPLPYHSNHHSHHTSQINQHESSNSSLSSLSSQPSLPSVPSLTPHTVNSSLAHREVSVLKAHSSYVFSAALAGKYVFTGDSSGEIRVWDVPSSNHNNNNNNIVAQSYSAVKCIVALDDDNKLVTSHQDHKIRVWKKVGGTLHYTLVTTLPTLGDRCVALFSSKSHVKVRRHKSSTWVHHVDTVSALALSYDGSLLYSVSWDRSFKIWRTSDFKCVESVCNAHDDAINAIVLSKDGFVYTGSADMKINVWKRENGEKRHLLVSTLEKHKSAVNALALSSDGCVLYSGACDRSIIVWEKDGGDATHMTVSGALRGHSKAILCLAVVEDLLCSGSADKTVRIWKRSESSSYSCVAVLEGHNGPVKCLTASAATSSSDDDDDSYLVYSGSLDFDVRVWQIWSS